MSISGLTNPLRHVPTYGKTEPATVPSTNLQRLYIGNLDPTVDEYTVVKLFEPFGKITFLDFLFHWQGTKKGQPRGYCFLEYSTKEEALRAIEQMHRKQVKNRPLIVSFAHSVPTQETSFSGIRKRRPATLQNATNRPNSLTVLRTRKMAGASTDAKIEALEKKLAAMKGNGAEGEKSGQKHTEESSKTKGGDDWKRFKPY